MKSININSNGHEVLILNNSSLCCTVGFFCLTQAHCCFTNCSTSVAFLDYWNDLESKLKPYLHWHDPYFDVVLKSPNFYTFEARLFVFQISHFVIFSQTNSSFFILLIRIFIVCGISGLTLLLSPFLMIFFTYSLLLSSNDEPYLHEAFIGITDMLHVIDEIQLFTPLRLFTWLILAFTSCSETCWGNSFIRNLDKV